MFHGTGSIVVPEQTRYLQMRMQRLRLGAMLSFEKIDNSDRFAAAAEWETLSANLNNFRICPSHVQTKSWRDKVS